MTNCYRNNIQKGQAALLIILISLIVITAVGLGLVDLVVEELGMSIDVKKSAMAIQMADTGIEQALYEHNVGSGLSDGSSGGWSSGNFGYSWSVTDSGTGDLIVRSSGETGNIKRTIEITIPNPPSMFLFWDGKDVDGNDIDIPDGWTCVSCSPGDDFYEKFPIGNDVFINFSESRQHYGSETGQSSDAAGTFGCCSGGSLNGCYIWHRHFAANVVSDETNQDPPYRNLSIIKYNNSVPETIPAGAIAIFESLPADDFTYYDNQEGFYIRGFNAGKNFTGGGGNDGGLLQHSHFVNGTVISMGTGVCVGQGLSGIAGVMYYHHHDFNNCITSLEDNNPPVQNVVLGKAEEDIETPVDLIAMFDNQFNDNSYWQALSNDTGSFYKKVLKGSNVYEDGGGEAEHFHTIVGLCTSGPPTNITITALSASATCAHPDYTLTASIHTHDLSSLSSASSYPDCQGVIIAKCQVLGGGSDELKGVVEDYREVFLNKDDDLDHLVKDSLFFDDFLKKISQKITEIVRNLINFV